MDRLRFFVTPFLRMTFSALRLFLYRKLYTPFRLRQDDSHIKPSDQTEVRDGCILVYEVRPGSYIVWFVGAVVWWADAVLHLRSGERTHAIVAIVISLLFLLAGVFFRRQALRK